MACIKRLSPYALTALLALLAALGALAMAGVYPFGGGTLAWQDNGQQVASDFGYVRGVVEERHALDWSFACGGSPRSSFHPTFNNLLSPLTWAVAALPSLGALERLSVLFLLQMALLPLGMLFCLRRSFPRLPAALGMALALAYAFGNFALTKYTFLPFLNVALLFPWYVAALDSLLRRGRWLAYTLLLAAMLAAGTYFAHMWLLFAAVYAAARTGWRWHSPVRQHSLLLVLASAGALALSACSWLPSLLVTMDSARAGESHFWWYATRAEFEPGFVSLFASLSFLVALLMEGARQRLRRRIGRTRYDFVLPVLVVGLLFVSAGTLWQLSRPWDFAGRFGYMLDAMLIACAAHYALRLRLRWRAALPLMVLAGALSLGFTLRHNAAEHGASYQASAARVRIAEWAAANVPAPAEGRATTRGNAAVENLAFFTPFDSLSHFTACITAAQERTPARWGYQQRTAVISTEGGTLATDTLLGLRYVLSQGADGAFRVDENPYAFGVGLMMPKGTFPLAPDADPIAGQQALLTKLLGAEYAGTRRTVSVGETVAPVEGSLLYLQQPAEGTAFRFAGDPYRRWGGVEAPPRLWSLPADRPVQLEGAGGSAAATAELYELPLASLEALKAYGQALPVDCTYAGRTMRIRCRSTAARPLLFLPLLWQAGYEAVVDGTPAPVQNLDGWVGITMPQAGEHAAELRYRPAGKAAGFALSAAALPLLLAACARTRRRPALAAPSAANTLCRRLMLAVALLLLLWPLLTLPVRLLWK